MERWTLSILKTLRWRAEFLVEKRAIPLRQRLMSVIPRVGYERSESLFRELLRYTDDGEPYFALGDGPLDFLPDYEVHDVEMATNAMLLVLQEAYLWDQEYFRGDVNIGVGDTVIDLGAHVGTATMAFAALTGPAGVVYAFEPVSTRSLERNIRARGMQHVHIVPAAAAQQSGSGAIEITDKAINSSISRPLAARDPAIASYHTDRHGAKQHPKLVALLADLGYRIHEVEQRRIYAW